MVRPAESASGAVSGVPSGAVSGTGDAVSDARGRHERGIASSTTTSVGSDRGAATVLGEGAKEVTDDGAVLGGRELTLGVVRVEPEVLEPAGQLAAQPHRADPDREQGDRTDDGSGQPPVRPSTDGGGRRRGAPRRPPGRG